MVNHDESVSLAHTQKDCIRADRFKPYASPRPRTTFPDVAQLFEK